MNREEMRTLIHRIDQATDQVRNRTILEVLIFLREEMVDGLENEMDRIVGTRWNELITMLCNRATREDEKAFVECYFDIAAEPGLRFIREKMTEIPEKMKAQCETQRDRIRFARHQRLLQKKLIRQWPEEEHAEMFKRIREEDRLMAEGMDRMLWLYQAYARKKRSQRNLQRLLESEKIKNEMDFEARMEEADTISAGEKWLDEKMKKYDEFYSSGRISRERNGLDQYREREGSVNDEHRDQRMGTEKEADGAAEGNPAACRFSAQCEAD